jgi:dethiobiotin synthetase
LEAAVAPHLAARRAGITLATERLAAEAHALAAQCDTIVVEGVGGWYVPLNERETVSDLAVRIGLPVILVVGLRLGCINHALLTAEAVERSGLKLAGWVANSVDPAMEAVDENLVALSERLHAPLLGVIPHLAGAEPGDAASRLDLDLLI